MFFVTVDSQDVVASSVDQYGDSYVRDVSVDELKQVGFCMLFNRFTNPNV